MVVIKNSYLRLHILYYFSILPIVLFELSNILNQFIAMNNQPNKSILHIIDTTGPGGAETIFLNLVENLALEGYKNIALIKGSGWVEEQLKKRNIEYLIKKPSGFLSIPYYIDLICFFKKQRVALVQAHLLGSILTCSIVCSIFRIPLVATLHGQVDINPREKIVFVKQWLLAIGVSRLVVVSKSLAEFIRNRGIFRHKKIEVIYNGIDTSRYYKSVQGDIRTKLCLDANTILIGSLGNIRLAKNYDLLIEAAAIVKQYRGDNKVHFLIAGHQRRDIMEKLNALTVERDITANIHFLGFLDDTPQFLSELDIFLLCSSSEGFSIATIEAMAAGVPVIATRCGGPEEIITDGINGLLIEKNNPIAIAEAIALLLKDKKRAEALADAAKDYVFSTFSLGTMLDRYRTIYKQLLEKISPASS
jgi:glycosyltransferase involved in cell wall biosynthesis